MVTRRILAKTDMLGRRNSPFAGPKLSLCVSCRLHLEERFSILQSSTINFACHKMITVCTIGDHCVCHRH